MQANYSRQPIHSNKNKRRLKKLIVIKMVLIPNERVLWIYVFPSHTFDILRKYRILQSYVHTNYGNIEENISLTSNSIY